MGLEKYGRVCKESMMALLFGKGVEGVSDIVMEEVGGCVMYWIEEWWQRRKDLLYGELIDEFWSPLLTPLEQLDTAHALLLSYFHNCIYFLINSNVFLFRISFCC